MEESVISKHVSMISCLSFVKYSCLPFYVLSTVCIAKKKKKIKGKKEAEKKESISSFKFHVVPTTQILFFYTIYLYKQR